jgi:hypothetical protein
MRTTEYLTLFASADAHFSFHNGLPSLVGRKPGTPRMSSARIRDLKKLFVGGEDRDLNSKQCHGRGLEYQFARLRIAELGLCGYAWKCPGEEKNPQIQ